MDNDPINEDIEYGINTVTNWAKNVWGFLEEFSNFCMENNIII